MSVIYIAYVITTIPQVTTQCCFILLAIDRVVGVAFPYCTTIEML